MRIAIIGAGFSGLGVAWHLLQQAPCEITLFESQKIGGGASGIAAGLLHPYVGEQGRRSVLATEGIEETRALIQVAERKLDKKVVFQTGVIRYVQTEEQRQMFLSHCQKFGDVRQYAENCFWIESGMTIDCPLYLQGLGLALFEKGVQLVIEQVTDLQRLKDFDHILVAAGVGLKQFPELSSQQISVTKGQVLKCRALESVQLPQVSSLGKAYVALSQESRVCYIGSTYERQDWTDSPQLEKVRKDLFPKVSLFFPSVEKLEVMDCLAAFRVGKVGHYLPIASRVRDNIWVLTAMGSRGLLYHAYMGKALAQSILSQG